MLRAGLDPHYHYYRHAELIMPFFHNVDPIMMLLVASWLSKVSY